MKGGKTNGDKGGVDVVEVESDGQVFEDVMLSVVEREDTDGVGGRVVGESGDGVVLDGRERRHLDCLQHLVRNGFLKMDQCASLSY